MVDAWMVRAGQGGRYFQAFRDQSFIAIGWKIVGDARGYATRRKLAERIRAVFPNYSDGMTAVAAGQMFRFVNEIKIEDRVITYDTSARTYNCGVVRGEYTHDGTVEIDEYANRRAVNWNFERSRDELSPSARNSLGSILTLFQLPKFVEAELWKENLADKLSAIDLDGVGSVTQPRTVERGLDMASVTYQQIQDEAKLRISDRVAALTWSEMQDLVAGLLRAMGHVAKVSPAGPDRGRDIIASPDGMGFKEPRIVAEVKHRKERMGAPEVRKFLGGRKPHENGLFVSTGGFTAEAHYEAERASIPLTLVDSDLLIEFLLTHYQRLDEKTRDMLRLAPLNWPL